MIVLILSLIAAASAAPQNFFHSGSHHEHNGFELNPYIRDDIFDTHRFWEELTKEMREMENMMSELQKHFSTPRATTAIEGDKYKVTLKLDGFESKDIIVKAREGLLMIQAAHHSADGVATNSYIDVRTLPTYVNPNGTWTFENDILTVVFPLTENPEAATTESVVTEVSDINKSREELEPSHKTGDKVGVEDIDVRGDNELETNEIPRGNNVEATTYAVDLKGEVEFVPVRSSTRE